MNPAAINQRTEVRKSTARAWSSAIVLIPLLTQGKSNREWRVDLLPHVDGISQLLEGADYDGDGVRDVLIGTVDRGEAGNGVTDRAHRMLCASGATGTQLWECRGPKDSTHPFAPPPTFGSVACCIGDIDGDGVPDVAASVSRVPCPSWEGMASSLPNAVWILSGKSGAKIREHRSPTESDDGFGASLTALHDIDSDGVAEYVISVSPGASAITPAISTPGRVLVFSGRSGEVLSRLGPMPAGPHPEGFGRSVATVGDLDGDGFDELAVGSGIGRSLGCTLTVYRGKTLDPWWSTDGAGYALSDRIVRISNRVTDGAPRVLTLGVPSDSRGEERAPVFVVLSGNSGALLEVVPMRADGQSLFPGPVRDDSDWELLVDEHGRAGAFAIHSMVTLRMDAALSKCVRSDPTSAETFSVEALRRSTAWHGAADGSHSTLIAYRKEWRWYVRSVVIR